MNPRFAHHAGEPNVCYRHVDIGGEHSHEQQCQTVGRRPSESLQKQSQTSHNFCSATDLYECPRPWKKRRNDPQVGFREEEVEEFANDENGGKQEETDPGNPTCVCRLAAPESVLQTGFGKGIPNGIGSDISCLLPNVFVSYGGTAVGADEGVVERFYLVDGFERLSTALVAGNLDLIHVRTPD
jgi:hypothetical protein